MLASEKCYQHASALQSLATKVPYEDVKMAAGLIAQCATNVLTVSRTSTVCAGVAVRPFRGGERALTAANTDPGSRRVSRQSCAR